MNRLSKITAMCGVAIAAGVVQAQVFTADFEIASGYPDAPTAGMGIAGVMGWYVPSAGGDDGTLFGWLDNTYGNMAGPVDGGGQGLINENLIGAFTRSQHDVPFDESTTVEVSYDMNCWWRPAPPAINNLSSVSFQNSAVVRHFIALSSWPDVNDPSRFRLGMMFDDAGGTQVAQPGHIFHPDMEFIPTGAWHNVALTMNFPSNRCVKVKVTLNEGTDVETVYCYYPTDWYLRGGADPVGTGWLMPTAVRFFTGGASGGNVTAWDNMLVSLANCPADFDGDGFPTGDDFTAYVVAFEAGDLTTDMDCDGFPTGDDFTIYVVAFEAGC